MKTARRLKSSSELPEGRPLALAGFLLKLAQVFNNAALASWFPGNASISAMQD